MSLAEFLEREAGYVALGVLLVLIGAGLWLAHVPK